MKFLFIVQGEGRGHLTQALTLEEHLTRQGHQVVEVLVGKSSQRELPEFFGRRLKAPLLRFESPNFLPTPANRRNKLGRSIAYNVWRLPTFVRSIAFINRRIRESGADVVVNFYELLTGLTYLFCRPQATQICIGHQYLFLHRDFEFPRVNRLSLEMLKMFTRITSIGANRLLALSFRRMPDDVQQHIYVVPPLLRREALRQSPSRGDYVLGYMVNSGFAEQVMEWHKRCPGIPLRFFWDRRGESTVKKVDDTLMFHQLDDNKFLEQMAGCRAYASTAGFESICEAMYMGKPILMVPAHIEQECNAHDAMLAGAGIVSNDFELGNLLDFSRQYAPDSRFVFWVNNIGMIIEHLVRQPEPEKAHYYTHRLLRRLRLIFN